MSETHLDTEKATACESTTLRLWPAVLFALTGFLVSMGVAQFGSTNEHSILSLFLAPMGAFALLLLWWLFASRVPWLDRGIGIVLLGLALAALYLGQNNADISMVRVIFTMFALPYLAYGVVIVFVLSSSRCWGVQRWLATGYIILATAILSLMTVEGWGGDLRPGIIWRWDVAPAMSVESPNAVATLPAKVGEDDWPAFRGAHNDGILSGVTFATDWATPPAELWRQEVGSGWSSFTVIGDYFYTQEQRGDYETVICRNVATGEIVWINSVEAHFVEITGPGPRATPTYKDGKLYTHGALGAVQCLDAATGEVLWKRDLVKDTGARVPQWGFACSPLIVDDLMFLVAGDDDESDGGSAVVAYEIATGEIAWNKGKGKTGYNTPHLTSIDDVPQILMISHFGIQSFTAETGEVLWEHEWRSTRYPRVIQPVITDEGAVFIGTPDGQGTLRIDVALVDGAWTVTEAWNSKKLRPYFNDGVYRAGHLYGFDGNRITCVDIETGANKWSGDRTGGQMLLIEDMEAILILSEDGEVILIKADPDEYTIISRFQAITGKTWNHPVIANGKLFVRNSAEMACYELKMD